MRLGLGLGLGLRLGLGSGSGTGLGFGVLGLAETGSSSSLYLPVAPYISMYLLTLSSSSRVNMKTACTWEMQGDIGRCREM